MCEPKDYAEATQSCGANPVLLQRLRIETEASIRYVQNQVNPITVLIDDTRGSPEVFAITGSKAFSTIIKWVGRQVETGNFDPDSERLFIKIVSSSERFVEQFGNRPHHTLQLLSLIHI